MVVWRYEEEEGGGWSGGRGWGGGTVGRGVEWTVAVQNVEAVRILLGCSYFQAGVLVGVGVGVRMIVGGGMLGLVGLRF